MKTIPDYIVLREKESEHYIFHFEPGSLAEKEIDSIVKEQEHCFDRICHTLDITFPGKISYYLLNSSDLVGALFGCDDPCNAFAALGENKIFATYNEEVQCVGCHEDVHLISSAINYPRSNFLVEGLAMFFDETWWGIRNEIWACYYKTETESLSVRDMLEDKDFYQCDCMISYPIAGAFVRYLIQDYGMARFLELYRYPGEDFVFALESIYRLSLVEIESSFWKKTLQISIDTDEIEAVLRDDT